MITGYDTVPLPARRSTRASERCWTICMLDGEHIGRLGEHVELFLSWRRTREQVPAVAGKLCVARDAEMKQRWDDVGYSLLSQAI